MPDDPDAAVRANGAMPFTPAVDYDGMVFVVRTTPAVPLDRARLMPKP